MISERALREERRVEREKSSVVASPADASMEPKDWNPTPSERHRAFMAKLEASVRQHAVDALDAWMYNNHTTLDQLRALMQTSNNLSSVFGKLKITNGAFALGLLWLLGFRWEKLDTEDGCALTLLPRAPVTLCKGACWKAARVACLENLVDVLDMDAVVGKKSALTDVLGASSYFVHHHTPEAAYLTVELRSKVTTG